MIQFLLVVPALPLIGFLINGFLGKKFSEPISGWVGCGSVLVSFVVSLVCFFELSGSSTKTVVVPVFDWIHTGTLDIPFSLYYDPLSAIMLLVITGVGFLIHWYSTAYMKGDGGISRYFAYLNLFIFFMLLLVLGSGYVSMFVGWEGVGLCSYLLIGFWFQHPDYNKAAKKAFIMNRIGDLGFLIGIYIIYQHVGSFEYTEVVKALTLPGTSTPFDSESVALAAFFLFIGAMGKSAQIPLFTWLPDAMAGPTPVSALIHAATMVTGGIYMVVRSHLLYSLSPPVLDFISIIGVSTLLLGALVAVTQNDIKKILAYSTVSQLGYMFLGLGVGDYGDSFFHVLTHAFFKALLFLGAGSLIHSMGGEQDIRKMGGMKKSMPVTFYCMTAGTLAISGVFPFSGFFSKDAILAQVFETNKILWVLGLLGAGLTSFYMFRLMFFAFYGSFKGTDNQKLHLHESPLPMTIPLVILAFLATIAGIIGVPAFLWDGGNFIHRFLAPTLDPLPVSQNTLSVSVAGEWGITLTTLGVVAIGFLLAAGQFKKLAKTQQASQGWIYRLSQNKFYVDEVYTLIIVAPLEHLSTFFYATVDRKWIDGLVRGVGTGSFWISSKIRKVQTGNTGAYLLLMVVGIIILLALDMFLFKS